METIGNIADYLVEHAAPSAEPEWLADVLGQLIWIMDDNGDAICGAIDQWLRGEDRRRVEIALAVDETFPFGGGNIMAEELRRIAERWPDLRDRCEQIVNQWTEQEARSSGKRASGQDSKRWPRKQGQEPGRS